MTDLESFLRSKAFEINPRAFSGDWPDWVKYMEDVNPDAINGDKWLKDNTSYIWKVGVLATWDANKCDWVVHVGGAKLTPHVYIGHQRSPSHDCEFIGHLYYSDGENDDIGRCLGRYLILLQDMHAVFESDLCLDKAGRDRD